MFHFEDFRCDYNHATFYIPDDRQTYDFKDLTSNNNAYFFKSMCEKMSYDDLLCDLLFEYRSNKNPVLLFKIAERIQIINPSCIERIWIYTYCELKKDKDNLESRKYLLYLMSFMWKSFFGIALNRDNTLYMKEFFDPEFIVNEVLFEIISLDDKKQYYAKEAYIALSYCYAFGIVVKRDLKKAREYLDKGTLYYVKNTDYKGELTSYLDKGIASYSFMFQANKLKFLTDYYSLCGHDSITLNCPRSKLNEVFFHYAFNISIARDYLTRILYYHINEKKNYINTIKSHWTLSIDEEKYIDTIIATKPSQDISFIKLPANDEKYTFRMATKDEVEQYFTDDKTKDTFCVEKEGKVLSLYKLNPSTNFDGMEYELYVKYSETIDEDSRKLVDKVVFDYMKKDEFTISEYSLYSLSYITKVLHPSFAEADKECLTNIILNRLPYTGDITYNLNYFAIEYSCMNEQSEVVYQF